MRLPTSNETIRSSAPVKDHLLGTPHVNTIVKQSTNTYVIVILGAETKLHRTITLHDIETNDNSKQILKYVISRMLNPEPKQCVDVVDTGTRELRSKQASSSCE